MTELRFPAVYLTEAQAAEVLHLSAKTLKNWRHNGQGPPYVRGRPVLYQERDLLEYLATRRLTPTQSPGKSRKGPERPSAAPVTRVG